MTRLSKIIKNRFIHFLLIIAGCAIGLLLAESVLLTVRYQRKHSFSKKPLIEHRQKALGEFFPDLLQVTPTNGRFENFLTAHPLFGYVWNPLATGINNFGFRSPYAIGIDEDGYYIKPKTSKSSSFVVGIFGGSFAEQMGVESRYLEELLARHFPTKKPIVINFGFAGYAMPQQAHVFLYFKELCDVAVFVDGLNEMWNTAENNRAGVPLEFAKAYHWLYLLSLNELTPGRLQSINAIHRDKKILYLLTRASLVPVARDSLFVHYSWQTFFNFLVNDIMRHSWEIAHSYEAKKKFAPLDNLQLMHFAALRWEKWHRIVHDAAIASGIIDIHALQPNPFVLESKQLTDEEKASISSSYHIQEYVEHGYPLLEQSLEHLKQQGLDCINLTPIFRDRTETLWVDSCHVNSQGYRIVLDDLCKRIIARATAPGHPDE